MCEFAAPVVSVQAMQRLTPQHMPQHPSMYKQRMTHPGMGRVPMGMGGVMDRQMYASQGMQPPGYGQGTVCTACRVW